MALDGAPAATGSPGPLLADWLAMARRGSRTSGCQMERRHREGHHNDDHSASPQQEQLVRRDA